ncbi:hypothetical protein P4597_27520 [Peribacillus simplex]|uniref:hypothetical protein n=1 Tax=Peribacillus simplex TaxID=1478 RepID=UPI002E2003A6|nr:hypothetical protein [Peribacillus simplex]
MGSGKTSAAISLMNKDKDTNFIYITPYLDEVKRIKSSTQRKFYEPDYYRNNKIYSSKFDSLHSLLSEEKNIVSTHALFKRANRTTRDLIYNGNYTLILDEVMDVVDKLDIKKNDLEGLYALGLVYEKDGYLLWNEDKTEWDSRYNDIRDMALNYNLFVYKDSILIWTFPADIFDSFKEVYILTYQFEAQIQKYYYDLHNIQYNKYIASNDSNQYQFTLIPDNYSEKEIKDKIKEKVNIIEHDKLNRIGDDKFSLSKSWYRNAPDEVLTQLKRHTENYYRNVVNSKANENLWTTFKDYKTKVQGKRYTKAFVSLNVRATNEYKDRTNCAYLLNRFPNTVIDNFLISKGIHMNKDYYAISEALQWIWRSAIREGNPINLYMPSKRMRTLIKQWLNDEEINFID